MLQCHPSSCIQSVVARSSRALRVRVRVCHRQLLLMKHIATLMRQAQRRASSVARSSVPVSHTVANRTAESVESSSSGVAAVGRARPTRSPRSAIEEEDDTDASTVAASTVCPCCFGAVHQRPRQAKSECTVTSGSSEATTHEASQVLMCASLSLSCSPPSLVRDDVPANPALGPYFRPFSTRTL